MFKTAGIKNRININIKELLSAHPIIKQALSQLSTAAFGFVLAYSGRGYAFSPLGAAFVSAVRENVRVSAALGSAFGYIMACDSLNSLRYIAAVLCAYILSRLLGTFEFRHSVLLGACISMFCVLSTGAALALAEEKRTSIIIGFFVESVIAFFVSALFKKAIELYLRQRTFFKLPVQSFSVYAFFLGIVLWSVSTLITPIIDPTRIAVFYLIMLFSVAYSGIGAMVFGTGVCAVFSVLSGGEILPVCFCVGAAACMLSGFSSKIIPMCSVSLLGVNAMLFFLDLPYQSAFMTEAAVAAILFVLTPRDWIKSLESRLTGSNELISDSAIRTGVKTRLRMAANAVSEVGNAVSAVSAGLDRGVPTMKSEVLSLVTSQLCRECSHYDKCWKENRQKTVENFEKMLIILRNNEVINSDNLPVDVRNSCVKSIQLSQVFNRSFYDCALTAITEKNRNEIRRSVAEQFGSVCDIIEDISLSLENDGSFDEILSQKVKILLHSFDIKARETVCRISENGRMIIEAECETITKEFNRTHLRDRLGELCKRRFELPTVISGETGDYISVCERYRLSVELGSIQITSNGEKLCGDSFETFYSGRGDFDVVLADGMGTGARAALDSSMTRGLAKKLIESGVSAAGTAKLVNSALIIKSKEESLSSLDIVRVDMFSGKTEFYKAGAAPSYIRRRGGRIQEIKKPALPLGILHRIDNNASYGAVSSGEIIVMVSDGIGDCGSEKIKSVIKKNSDKSSKALAEALTDEAKKEKGERHDDLTAVVCKFY